MVYDIRLKMLHYYELDLSQIPCGVHTQVSISRIDNLEGFASKYSGNIKGERYVGIAQFIKAINGAIYF
jgi:hypothetical protein